MTYVYKCRGCGEVYEVEQPITDAPRRFHWEGTRPCSGSVFRVPQVPRVIYYGSGFHCNDYGQRFKEDKS